MASDQQISLITANLNASFDPLRRAAAELQLREIESALGFSSALLEIVCDCSNTHDVRFAAAVYFKNFIRNRWEQENFITDVERAKIRSSLVPMLITTETKIQLQITATLTIIASHDFPHIWSSMVGELVQHLNINNFAINNVILQTLHDIFKRWRNQLRSNELYSEILIVLGVVCDPFKQIFLETDLRLSTILSISADRNAADLYMQTMLLLSKIFHSLNLHDIPEFFEDNIAVFFPVFLRYLKLSHSFWEFVNKNEDEEETEPTPLERLKTEIYHIASLYTERYTDVWGIYTSLFVDTVWQELACSPSGPHADEMVCCAMTLLTVAVQRPSISHSIKDGTSLESILQLVVIPNLSLRLADEELLENEPHLFVRREVASLDHGTRRSAAINLIKALLENFEERVVVFCSKTLELMLSSHEGELYKVKDRAIALFVAVTSKEHITSAGLRPVQNPENSKTFTILPKPIEFFQKYLLPDLQHGIVDNGVKLGPHKLSLINALRFFTIFRPHFDRKAHIIPMISTIASHLQSKEIAVCLSAAVTLDRILSTFGLSEIPTETINSITEYLMVILRQGAVSNPGEMVLQNDALLRTLFRCIRIGDSNLRSVFELCLMLLRVAYINPSNPIFIHYVFEIIALTIRMQCEKNTTQDLSNRATAISHCEENIFPVLLQILDADIPDFVPYVFQIFSQMLRFNQSTGNRDLLPAPYALLFDQIFQPSRWEHPGSVPAIVMLLESFIDKAGTWIAFCQGGKLGNLLFVFQKLFNTRAHEILALEYLESIIIGIPEDQMKQFIKPLLTEILKRLSNHPLQGGEPRRVLMNSAIVVVFGYWFSSVIHVDSLVSEFESIQPGILELIICQVVAPVMEQIPAYRAARRAAILGWTRFLSSDSSRVCSDETFAKLIVSLASMLEKTIPQNKNQPSFLVGGEEDLEVEDRITQSSFSRLTAAVPSNSCFCDPMPTEPDSRDYFIRTISNLMNSPRKFAIQLAFSQMKPELANRFNV